MEKSTFYENNILICELNVMFSDTQARSFF